MKRWGWLEHSAASELGYRVGLAGRWPTDAEVARFKTQRLDLTFKRAILRGKRARASRAVEKAA
jgi:hypothetical protein